MDKMKTLKIKITLLSISILIFTMTLLTGYSLYNSNKYFVTPLTKSVVSTESKTQKRIERKSDNIDNKNSNIDSNIDEQIGELSVNYNVVESQKSFRDVQIFVMILISGVGAILIYVAVAKSLKSLDILNKAAKEIDETSLDKQIDLPKSKDEVYYLTKSFNNMLSRLKGSFEIQKNFSYNAAHELKTPLTVIKSSIDVLELDENPTIEDYKENIVTVKESTNELIQIVEQLLSISSTEKIDTQILSLEKVILQCIEEYKKEIEDKSIDVVINLYEKEINSNMTLLRSVISNIISNAIKYNNDNGSITITSIKDKNNIIIKISDTGIGVEESDLPHIFEAFYRVDPSRSKQIKGNGLGLSIVKVSLEKLNGEICIDSCINSGTDVLIRLPFI